MIFSQTQPSMTKVLIGVMAYVNGFQSEITFIQAGMAALGKIALLMNISGMVRKLSMGCSPSRVLKKMAMESE
ncbi:MAG: hypothetical protein PVH22_15705, partial [Desulfobacteraceae bacterium]